MGLNLDNWGTGPGLDMSEWLYLSLAVSGPASGHALNIMLVDTSAESGGVTVPAGSAYDQKEIPLSSFTGADLVNIKEIRFSLGGVSRPRHR